MGYHFQSDPMGLHSFSNMLLPHVALAFVDIIARIFASIVLVFPLNFPACLLRSLMLGYYSHPTEKVCRQKGLHLKINEIF